MISIADIEKAHIRIMNLINITPIQTSRTLNKLIDSEIFLKCENFQRGGAFKFRGVCNKLLQLSAEEKEKGIITHSSGNHAQALALGSSILGIKSVVVMPKNTPKIKMDATREYGAEIVECANNIGAREETCNTLISKYGYTLVHPYDDDTIITGAGTAAFELINNVKNLDFIFCPIGGGGLISGTSIVAKGLCPNITVVGVEPKEADDAYRSFTDGKFYTSSYPDTIADGLRTSLSERTFNYIKNNVDQIITVDEKEIVDAMKFLWTRMKLVVEPSGAVSLAGIIKIRKNLNKKRVGAIISGGNIDLNKFFNDLI
jgi:threonine dehydratase